MARRRDLDLDIEFFADRLLQRDRDTPLVDIAPPLFHGLGRHVAQHLEPVLRTAHERSEGHGDR